jgi:hypothetical protein
LPPNSKESPNIQKKKKSSFEILCLQIGGARHPSLRHSFARLAWWSMPIISATGEVKAGGSWFEVSIGKKHEFLSEK